MSCSSFLLCLLFSKGQNNCRQDADWKELRSSDELPFSQNFAFEETPREQRWQLSKTQTPCQISSRGNLDRAVTIKSNLIMYK